MSMVFGARQKIATIHTAVVDLGQINRLKFSDNCVIFVFTGVNQWLLWK